MQQLIQHPDYTVIIHAFGGRELTQRAVASEKRLVVYLGERERKAVGKGQGGDPASVVDGGHHFVAVECLNTQPQIFQSGSVEVPQLAFVEKIGNGKLPVKLESCLD